jgi:hypothetical protein
MSDADHMHPHVARALHDALKSGDYKQGHNFLHKVMKDIGDLYCCLGVLCRLAINAGVVVPQEEFNLGNGNQVVIKYEGDDGWLGLIVSEWAGKHATPSYRLPLWYDEEKKIPFAGDLDEEMDRITLAILNDGDSNRFHGLTFSQIADIVLFMWGYGDEDEVSAND